MHACFKLLGNHQLSDPIFMVVIKVTMDNATFWDKIQTVEQASVDVEGNKNSFVSAASTLNNNFTYQFPVQHQLAIPVQIP